MTTSTVAIPAAKRGAKDFSISAKKSPSLLALPKGSHFYVLLPFTLLLRISPRKVSKSLPESNSRTLWFICLVLQTAFAHASPCGKSKAMAGNSITQAKGQPNNAGPDDRGRSTQRPFNISATLSGVAGSTLATKTQLAKPPAVKR
jgi:hypothetical protein